MKNKKNITSRDIQAQNTQKRLYETALSMIKEKGFNNVTISEITKAAGVAKGTFYTYFSNKDAVLIELFKNIDHYYESAFVDVPDDTPADEQLLILIRAMCEYCSQYCGLNIMKVVYMNQIDIDPRPSILNNKTRYLYKKLTAIAQSGQKSGLFSTDLAVNDIVALFARSMHGLIYDWCLGDAAFNLLTEGPVYFGFALKSIQS